MGRIVLCALGAVLFAGCATSKGYLASVNGERITGDDLQTEFSRRHAAMGKFMTGDEQMVRQYVDTVVSRRLMLQEAEGLGLIDDPVIQTSVTDYEESQVSKRLFDAEVTQKSKATDDEVKAFYEKIGPAYLAREIVVATKAEADAISAELEKGGDFEALARARSKAASANRGGRMAPVQYGTADEDTEAALLALEVGGKSEPFEHDGEWHLVWLEQKIDLPTKPELAVIEAKIRQVVEERKSRRLDRELRTAMREKYAARVTWDGLAPDAVRSAATAKDENPAAEWNGGKLSKNEFASRLDLGPVDALPPDQQPARLAEFLDELLMQKLFFAEATARGLRKHPEVVEAVRRYREQLIENELFEKYVYRGVTVTDGEVRADFDAHPDVYKIPESREVTQILVSDLDKAKAAKAKVDSGVPFDTIQEEFADDPAAARGSKGEGWVELKTMPAIFAEVFKIGEGETTQPVKSEAGYHLVKVLAIKSEQPLLFENVRNAIRDDLLAKKKGELTKAWSDKLRKDAKIKISKAGIKAYVTAHPPPESGDAPAAPASHGPEAGSMPMGAGMDEMPPPNAAPVAPPSPSPKAAPAAPATIQK
jgi:peptidyl-prolyl cis-trans isomerase C